MRTKGRIPTWTDCKRNLDELDRAGLIQLIKDLYAASKDNQSFLQARFDSETTALKPYKDAISRWVSPNVFTNQYYSVSKAKKAISDYRKAKGDSAGLAELSVFYCEEAVAFANAYGIDDEGYACAIARMFEQSLKSIKNTLSKRQQSALIDRLDLLRQDIQFGYGVEESMNEKWAEYGFGDE